jgi:YARHG domain
MNFAKLLLAITLLTSLSTMAAGPKGPAKKQARKAANKVMCVPLNKPFSYQGDDQDLHEVQALRNSIYAQYGYQFVDAEIAKEMKERGCQADGVTYKYANLSQVDKTNIRQLKSIESEIALNTPFDFNQSWKTAKPKERIKLLNYSYCHLYTKEDFAGILLFDSKSKSGKRSLSGLFDFSNVKGEDENGKSVKLDATAVRSLDATSLSSTPMTAKGLWTVDNDGNVVVEISPITKSAKTTKLQIDGQGYNDTRILTCTIVD